MEPRIVALACQGEDALDAAWAEHLALVEELSPSDHPSAPETAVLRGLRALLYDDFAEARTWSDLEARLALRGYGLAGVMPLVRLVRRGGARVCQIEELGPLYQHELARIHLTEPARHRGRFHSESFSGVRDMADGYSEGTKVEWDWGNGTATGTVSEVYTQKRTLKIKGEEVTRDADEDNPAYKIEQDDGDIVLKSHSEVRKAS